MSRQSIETLMDRWTNDSTFRDEMRADPQGTVRRAGVELSAEETAALNQMDWSLADEELQARVSKIG